MTDLPAPPVPADLDLRNFQEMPLEVTRLMKSDIASHPDAEVFRMAVLSWCESWHQVPASSLPNDDAALARLLGLGRDLKGWKKIRASGALRGWVLHSDGRLYHPVVSQKALAAKANKDKAKVRREADAERMRLWREKQEEIRNGTHNVTRDKTSDKTVSERVGLDWIGLERIGADQNSIPTSPPPSGVSPREEKSSAPGGDGGEISCHGKNPPQKKSIASAKLAARVGAVERDGVHRALAAGDLRGLLVAFGANCAKDRIPEWRREAGPVKIGIVATVLWWAFSKYDSIREPSGFRQKIVEYEALPLAQRREIVDLAMADMGISIDPPAAA